MKKIIALVLVFIMGVALFAGCGESSTEEATESLSENVSATKQNDEEETDQVSNESGKTTNSALAEVEPYMAYLGEIVEDNTINLSTADRENVDNVEINGIKGSVSFSPGNFGAYIEYVDTLKWEAVGSYTFEDYDKVREAILNFYDIDTNSEESYDADAISFFCENEYVTISGYYNPIKGGERSYITILWTLNADTFDQAKVSCYIAAQILKDSQSFPSSLQVNDIGYCEMANADESGIVYGVHINYSAVNEEGRNSQGDYYIFIDPATHMEASSMPSADSVLPDQTFESVDVNLDDPSSLNVKVNNSVPTHMIDKAT